MESRFWLQLICNRPSTGFCVLQIFPVTNKCFCKNSVVKYFLYHQQNLLKTPHKKKAQGHCVPVSELIPLCTFQQLRVMKAGRCVCSEIICRTVRWRRHGLLENLPEGVGRHGMRLMLLKSFLFHWYCQPLFLYCQQGKYWISTKSYCVC